MDEYCKCRFCKSFDSFDGCQNVCCENHELYEPNKDRIIEKSKEKNVSVSDVIALIEM